MKNPVTVKMTVSVNYQGLKSTNPSYGKREIDVK